MRTQRYAESSTLLMCVALLLAVGVTCLAANETPETTTIKIYLPCNTLWASYHSYMTTELVDQGYSYNSSTDVYADSTDDNDPGECTMGNYEGLLMSGCNFWIVSHGGSGIQYIERFHSEGVRDDRLDTLVPTYYSSGEVQAGEASGGYYVVATSTAISSWSTAKKQIMYLGTCYSSTLFGSYAGGLELGYEGVSSSSDDYTNAPKLFHNMSGRLNNGTNRVSAAALAVGGYTSNFRHGGAIDSSMVLAPSGSDYFPKNNVCASNCKAWVEFDCTMKNDTTNLVGRSGCVNFSDQSVTWVSTSKVEFDITEASVGSTGTLTISANHARSANNDVKMDGNKVAANGDNFSWSFNCTASACDPAFMQPDQRRPDEVTRLRSEHR